jgi:hypothetical protein
MFFFILVLAVTKKVGFLHTKKNHVFLGGGIKLFGCFLAIFRGFCYALCKISGNPDFPTPWPGILPGGGLGKMTGGEGTAPGGSIKLPP